MNNHPHPNSRFPIPRQQRHNYPPNHPDHRLPHPNHSDSHLARSDHHPPFHPPDHRLRYQNPPCNRRRENFRSRRDSLGYGGMPTSNSPERATPVMGRSLSPLSLRTRSVSPPYPPYRFNNYSNERHDSDPSPPKSCTQNNPYRGGCPFIYPASRTAERKPQTTRNANSQLHRSLPNHEEGRDTLSLQSKGNPPNPGPVKSVYSSQSPVKPVNPCSAPSSPALPATAKQTQLQRNPAPTHTGSDGLFNGFLSSFRLDKKPYPSERRYERSLSCEKVSRLQGKLSQHSSRLREGSASLGYSAIAPPIKTASVDIQPATQNQVKRKNGQYSQSNERSHGTQEKVDQNGVEDSDRVNNHQNQKRESIEHIFKRNPGRLPKVPEDNKTNLPTLKQCQKDDTSLAQSKQEVRKLDTGSDTGKTHVKLPLLRSEPAPIRSSAVDDTPQKRAAAAALLRAGQADCEEVKLVQKYQRSGNTSSRKDVVPSDSEPQKSKDDTEKKDRAVRPICATSVSIPGPMDQQGAPSNRKTGTKLDVDNSNQRTQDSFRGDERQDVKKTKRRGTDIQESDRVAAKRPRPDVSLETVSVEDHVPLRRSQRFQQPKTNKTWEITKFEPDRVQNLFQAQLRAQPMLLRISFLGISDGDLRSTLDLFKNGTNLPEPDYRSLEVNNNRIRCITNEICTSISALRVSSLNLSCNMLTTLGDRLGLCSKLKFLNLSRNRISCLPQELCDLTNLEVLNLSDNNIAKLPSGLCRLKKLEILSLARNKLEVLPEDIAGEGAALTGLDISHNIKFHFFPRCTEHWTKLVVLHMPDTEMYRSLSRREHRLRPSALLKELAGRNQDMRVARRSASRSQGGMNRR